MAEFSMCVCGRAATESHHIMFKSHMKSLEHCKLNQISLCQECHRGTKGVHGRLGQALNKQLKLKFQSELQKLFKNDYYTFNEIKVCLEISEKATDRLCKTIKQKKGIFSREDIIRATMGGKLIESEEFSK
ncbi:MAG: hypothetical protein LLF98_11660 [Clostridium sp.]|uniref:hypothetical protein n=1 Tax=Clostridium sp. TaxID=1506 RepID=UPI0025C2B6CB|nr:hypothetical protein [Clostridium sp.]MCE5221885.1 hypothetical protein [Clostridium sp.]